MRSAEEKQERMVGWVLAAAVMLHLSVMGANPGFQVFVFAILVAGAAMRWRNLFVPNWLGRLAILIGIGGVIMCQEGFRPSLVVGEVAGMVGALLLLRPALAARGLQVLLCLLVMLTAAILNPFTSLGAAFVIGDTIALLLVAEQIHRPPEAVESVWVSVVRAFRIVVPVGIVVTTIFWLFPKLSDYTPVGLTGFSVDGILNPGAIAELSASHRVALVAHFGEGQTMPSPADLYWRGRVLEVNGGLSWSLASKRVARDRSLQDSPPSDLTDTLSYRQELSSTRGGIVPALDHAVFVDAQRDGTPVAVLEIGAGVLTAVGTGPLGMEIISKLRRSADEPVAAISNASTDVPKEIASSRAVFEIVAQVASEGRSVSRKIDAVTEFFRGSGFIYTTRPGRLGNLEQFLTTHRRGFCEHYAAAAANLLRLAGVPARVVTGYRGGVWNPWLRTITVRDSNAHAWVEAWDGAARHWIRFDPTDAVDESLAGRIAREMDASQWSIFRRMWSFSSAVTSTVSLWISGMLAAITASEAWAQIQMALFRGLVVVALLWMVRNFAIRRASGIQESAARHLAVLESHAARLHRGRRPGETPLAWLTRIAATGAGPDERRLLEAFAHSYAEGMYRPPTKESGTVAKLPNHVRRLLALWRRRRLVANQVTGGRVP